MADKSKEYEAKIREFVKSEAWVEYLRPMLNRALQGELPKPNEKGWEEKYRYYYSLAEAFSAFINALENISGKEEFVKRMEENLKHAVDEA